MNDFRAYKGAVDGPYLMHYGKGHAQGGHSGRYEWGSGERPYQRTPMDKGTAKKKIKELNRGDKAKAEIGYSVRQLEKKWNKNKIARTKRINKLYRQGKSEAEIASDRKLQKLVNRNKEEFIPELAKSTKKLEEINSNMRSVAKELSEGGWDITSKSVYRSVNKSGTAVRNILGVIGSATLGVGVFTTGPAMRGTKYKLGKNRDLEAAKQELKEAEKDEKEKTYRYMDMADKIEGKSKDDKDYEDSVKALKQAEKEANDSMVKVARLKHQEESDEKIAKRIGFPVEEVRSSNATNRDESLAKQTNKITDMQRQGASEKDKAAEVKKALDMVDEKDGSNSNSSEKSDQRRGNTRIVRVDKSTPNADKINEVIKNRYYSKELDASFKEDSDRFVSKGNFTSEKAKQAFIKADMAERRAEAAASDDFSGLNWEDHKKAVEMLEKEAKDAYKTFWKLQGDQQPFGGSQDNTAQSDTRTVKVKRH